MSEPIPNGMARINALFNLALFGRFHGLTGKPFRMMPKRWLGHKVTKWQVDEATGRPAIVGHVRV